jgi:membrane-bound lytic murein transglycosylase D
MRFFAVALFFCGAAASTAQTPAVSRKMRFAGMTLTLSDGAREEIQKDVDVLTRHVRYFNMKVERAKAYFPIIEKIFDEEGVPEDFKFLVLQESALVADAVSVSNAVGFWQFKDFTAMEMGMRVDKDIDERMNLVSSTRGAARYLKQNNYYFNNWLLALQSYQMGAGGVQRAMGDSLNGTKHMEITSDTYWYVKTFLAHKAAFENALSGNALMKLISYEPKTKMTLKEIAQEVSVQEDELKEYNKWLKTSSIPEDKIYTVLIPVGNVDRDFTKLILASNKASKAVPREVQEKGKSGGRLAINSIPALVALAGENATLLAQRGGVSLSSFLKSNEISIDHAVEAGDVYFLSRKKAVAEQETYKVRAGDNLWSISQQFGVKIKSIKKYNRMNGDPALIPGSIVWLKASKPKEELQSISVGQTATLENDSFDWYIKSPKETATVAGPAQQTEEAIRPKTLSDTAAVVLPIANEVADALSKSTEHRVSAGETLYSIAREYNLRVTDLLTWNNLTIQNGLTPGQILRLVENEPLETGRTEVKPAEPLLITHEVKGTETLYSVARQYGVTIKDIMDWNHKKDFSLSRGEKLEIRQSNR